MDIDKTQCKFRTLHPARRVDIRYVIQDFNVFHDLLVVLFGKFIRFRIKPDRGKTQRLDAQGVALSGTYKRLLQLLLLIGLFRIGRILFKGGFLPGIKFPV